MGYPQFDADATWLLNGAETTTREYVKDATSKLYVLSQIAGDKFRWGPEVVDKQKLLSSNVHLSSGRGVADTGNVIGKPGRSCRV